MADKVNILDVIDRAPFGPVQRLVVVLCGLSMVIDGFDVQAMGYVAPALIQEWGIAKSDMGPVFGAGLLGITVGSLAFSFVADKVGRRPVLIAALAFLSACMLATAYASSVNQLIVLRFITGLGMGAVVPNAMALTGEFSPARIRVTLMMLVSCGFIVGGAVGGAFAAVLIPAFGWRSVFLVGALAPALVVAIMLVSLPESLQFLVVRGRNAAKVLASLRKVDPAAAIDAGAGFMVPAGGRRSASIAALFQDGLAAGTALLWVVNFMNLLCAYFLANWLPILVSEAGHSASMAVVAGTVFWVGGVAGNLLLGWVVDRRGFPPVLSTTFLAAALSIALIGQVHGSLALVLVAISAAGFCILGAQSGLNALGPTYYPVSIRSTGTGWASGVGRFGSILGPVVGGELIRLNWSTSDLFSLAAVPAGVAALTMLVFWRAVKMPGSPDRTAVPVLARS